MEAKRSGTRPPKKQPLTYREWKRQQRRRIARNWVILIAGTSDKLSSSGSLCDVLDETGNVVLSGLGSCYSYYSNSLNALPDHVFVARRGFYSGWMDTDGNWLYCRSIFSSVNDDDELGY